MLAGLTGSRTTSFQWRLLDRTDAELGVLDGVADATIDWSVAATIRASGQMSWAGKDAASIPDWLQVRFQPWIFQSSPSGAQLAWPLGVFIPSTPDIGWTDTGPTATVDLYDKLQLLVSSKVSQTLALDAGTVVTDAVLAQLVAAGAAPVAAVSSAATLSAPLVFDPGTTRLQVVNQLLAAINYFALWVDGYGVFQVQPYVAPAARGVQWEFGADPSASIVLPDFTHSEDTFDVPNVVTLITAASADAASRTSTARNDDPASPLSTVNRGEVDDVTPGVEATDQATLDGLAQRRLTELSQVSSTLTISHAPLNLVLNDLVTFRRDAAALNVRAVVQKMSLPCRHDALMNTTLLEVTT